MSVVTTNEIIEFFNQLVEGKISDPEVVFSNLMERLPLDIEARKRILNPVPPSISPVTLLGTALAVGKIAFVHCKMLEQLIDKGGDPNLHDKNGLCIIHHAVKSLISDKETAVKDKIALIELMINRGAEAAFFEAPTAEVPTTSHYLKIANPAEIIVDYITEKLLKGQKKDPIIELHSGNLKINGKPALQVIKSNAFKEEIVKAFISDIFLEQNAVSSEDAVKYREKMSELQELLSKSETSVKEIEVLIDSIPPEIKSKNLKSENVLKLVKRRVEFIARCDKTVNDYNKMKMIGHCLGLRGRFENGENNVITYEQFDVNQTMPRMAQEARKYLDKSASQSDYTAAEFALLTASTESLEHAAVSQKTGDYSLQAERYLKGEPVMIPCIYEDHFASAVLYKDKLYFCNKDSGCTKFPGIECYQINLSKKVKDIREKMKACQKELSNLEREEKALKEKSPSTESDSRKLEAIQRKKTQSQQTIKELLEFEKSVVVNIIKKLSTQVRYLDGANDTAYENLGLPAIRALEPQFIYRKKLHGQKQGNCSYTNNKRAFEAAMLALQDDPQNAGKYDNVKPRKLYQAFSQFDRVQTVKEHIEHYKSQDPRDERLLDPLFNFLRYKTPFNDKNKIEIAKEIINQLRSIGYSDVTIAQKMQEVKYPPHKIITKFINVATDLTEGSQIEGKRKYYLKRAANSLFPGQEKREMISCLRSAGMSEEGIATLKHKRSSSLAADKSRAQAAPPNSSTKLEQHTLYFQHEVQKNSSKEEPAAPEKVTAKAKERHRPPTAQ